MLGGCRAMKGGIDRLNSIAFCADRLYVDIAGFVYANYMKYCFVSMSLIDGYNVTLLLIGFCHKGNK